MLVTGAADRLAFTSVATSQKSFGNTLKARRTFVRLLIVIAIVWPLLAWVAARALIVKANGARKADAIVVLSNTAFLEERSRHAADLFLTGRASRIILTNESQISRWSESKQRNLY